MLTVGRNILNSGGVGIVRLGVEVLVVDKDLLEFDSLLGLYTIKQLGRMSMTSSSDVKFSQRNEPI